jgi:hypothetical protein
MNNVSQAKIAANRRNGGKSRGPRTANGRSRAGRNALRHGLATITRRNPALFPEIDRIAHAICNGDQNPFLFEQAVIIAENQVILRCVRAERIAVIERLRDRSLTPLQRDTSIVRAEARFRLAKLEYERRVQAKSGNSNPKATGKSEPKSQNAATKPPRQLQARDEFGAMLCATPDLIRLDRYERRAWSRRKRAINKFIEIKHSLNDRDNTTSP